ncbi:MAG: RluA family pseudouridine synthase [Candidatus Gracilibacteria bacterium]
MQFQTLEVKENLVGKRLDVALAEELKTSRTATNNLIANGHVLVNKKVIQKPALRLQLKDLISYTIPKAKPTEIKAEDIPMEIIFEDKEIVVINKPAGITVHPDSTGHASGTIVNAMLSHLKFKEDDSLRPGIVHRLDKDTSGVLLIAKNDASLQKFSKLFHDRQVKKTYIALVKGHPKTETGKIEGGIKRDSKRRKQMAINSQGKNAITTFEIIKKYTAYTLLKVNILTGRTHQIRLHMASIGLPIVGDTVYGDKATNEHFKHHHNLTRQFLHAKMLEIDGKTFTAKEPEDLAEVLKDLI